MFFGPLRIPVGKRLAASVLATSVAIGTSYPAQAAHLRDNVSLSLVAYSTPAIAYNAIIPAFKATSAGKNIDVTGSYGPSGDQSIKVTQGLSADVVNFSLEPDMGRLVKDHLVASGWYKNKYHGFVTDSIVVFVVRKGNPKHVKTWSDLLKSGIQLVNPNPLLSGSAKWNIMAAYGAQIQLKKSPAQAIAYLQKMFTHIVSQDKSGSAAMATFTSGKGDVLLSYQNEAIAAQKNGAAISMVVPPQSLLIENPVAVVQTGKHLKEARAFVNYLYSKPAQTAFASTGFRSVRADVAKKYKFPNPKTLFTIRTLGGWPKVDAKFFDPTNGIVTRIEHGLGS